jgi:hypothetical protein
MGKARPTSRLTRKTRFEHTRAAGETDEGGDQEDDEDGRTVTLVVSFAGDSNELLEVPLFALQGQISEEVFICVNVLV